MFDVDESIHLALHASSVGDHHACMTYLKEVLQQQPANAVAIYLLAVQHAELGLIERAIRGMQAALGIEAKLEIARFQLGLLLLETNRGTEAKEHFSALGVSRDDALRTYAEALVALVEDNLALAREKLAAGLSRKSANTALSALMRRLLDKLAKSAETATTPESQDDQVFLGAYRHASS